MDSSNGMDKSHKLYACVMIINECNKYFKPSCGDLLDSNQKVNSLSYVRQ